MAFQYARVGRREEQRLFSFENGTCLEFGPNDPVDEFDLDHHPFCNQVALVDKAIRDVKAVRDRYSARPTRPINGNANGVNGHINGGQQLNGGHEEANGDTNGHIVSDDSEGSAAGIEAFDDFRSRRADPSQVSEVVLESGTYLQVPSRFATLHNMVSVYTTTNKSDMPGEAHPGWNPDTRFGTNGRPPFETVPRQQRRQAERTFAVEQEVILEPPQGRGRGRTGGANRTRDSGNNRQQHGPNHNGSHQNPFSGIDPEVLANAQAAQIQQLWRNAQRGPQSQQVQRQQVSNNSAQQLPLQFIGHAQLMTSRLEPEGFVDFGYPEQQFLGNEASMQYARFLDDQNDVSRVRGDHQLRGDMMNGGALRLHLIPPSPGPINLQSTMFNDEEIGVLNAVRQPLRPSPLERFGQVQLEAAHPAQQSSNQQSVAQPRVVNSPPSRPAFLSRFQSLPLGFPAGFQSAFSSPSSLNSPPEVARPLDLGSIDQRLRQQSSFVPSALRPPPIGAERCSSTNPMTNGPTGTESAGHLQQPTRRNLGFFSQVVSRDASPGAAQRRWNGRGGRRLFESGETSVAATPGTTPATPSNLAVGSNRPQPRRSATDFPSQPSR
ncbi:hypothetical protein B0J14DRAFT_646430 [Halenospora varia]|nr:hypothetical protein B0J14DRAFT_646430 [Halenospora varia]